MAPKKSSNKRTARNFGGMNLRSGPLKKRQVQHEDGSSRILPLLSPRKRGRKPSCCVYIDDEASVDGRSLDEASNSLLGSPNLTAPLTVTPQSNPIRSLSFRDDPLDVVASQDDENVLTKHNRVFGENLSLGLMNDVMSQFYIVRSSEPPLVPLCRLVATDAVRVAISEASWLIPLFDRATYVPTMGSFIVSLKGRHGETKLVTQDMVDKWDPIWQKLNADLERRLTGHLKDLRGKAFFVWDGNHRLKTWMKRIEDVHSLDERYHVQVKCQFIEFEKQKEAELILSLDTTNEISRAIATPNLGHEIFMFQKFGLANKQSILERLTPEQRSWMEVELKFESRHNQGVTPWYSTPCILISQLVWKGKWDLLLSEEESKIRSQGLQGAEMKRKMDEFIKHEEEKFRDSGYKYLSIANPAHGEEFFSIIFNKDWNDKSMVGLTKDKLYSLCTAKISPERRKELLHLMTLTKVKDPKGSQFADYKRMRSYMRQEAYWHGMFEESCLLIARFEVEGPPLPKSFEVYFKGSRKLHVTLAYTHLLSNIKSASDCAALPEVLYSSKRLVYRWLLDCFSQKIIDSMPVETEEWLDMVDENTMFSPTIVEKGINRWECSNCPWWLEYPIGVVPKNEQDLHARFLGENPSAVADVTTTSAHDVTEPPVTNPSTTISGKEKGKAVRKGLSKQTRRLVLSSDEDEEESLPGISMGRRGIVSSATISRSIVAESILSRPASERMPSKRNIGPHYATYVDALLVDVEEIDDMAWSSIESWFQKTRDCSVENHEYHLRGEPSEYVARLIFADFPTSMLVHGIHDANGDGTKPKIPIWNAFKTPLVKGVMDIADIHLADEGFLVTLSLAQHLGKLVKYAGRFGLQLHRSWTLMCDGGYLHPDTGEQVMDLTIGLFYRKSMSLPHYDRKAGEEIAPELFPASKSYVTEALARLDSDFTCVGGDIVRGGAERSSLFFSWLLTTFTNSDDRVIDIFAGCGGLGTACAEEIRHCLMLECDFFAFSECLEHKVCGPEEESD